MQFDNFHRHLCHDCHRLLMFLHQIPRLLLACFLSRSSLSLSSQCTMRSRKTFCKNLSFLYSPSHVKCIFEFDVETNKNCEPGFLQCIRNSSPYIPGPYPFFSMHMKGALQSVFLLDHSHFLPSKSFERNHYECSLKSYQ